MHQYAYIQRCGRHQSPAASVSRLYTDACTHQGNQKEGERIGDSQVGIPLASSELGGLGNDRDDDDVPSFLEGEPDWAVLVSPVGGGLS